MGGRVVEGTGLENRQGFIAPRGFESHPIRQLICVKAFARVQTISSNRPSDRCYRHTMVGVPCSAAITHEDMAKSVGLALLARVPTVLNAR